MRPFYRVLSYIILILQSLIILVLLHRHPAAPVVPNAARQSTVTTMVSARDFHKSDTVNGFLIMKRPGRNNHNRFVLLP